MSPNPILTQRKHFVDHAASKIGSFAQQRIAHDVQPYYSLKAKHEYLLAEDTELRQAELSSTATCRPVHSCRQD